MRLRPGCSVMSATSGAWCRMGELAAAALRRRKVFTCLMNIDKTRAACHVACDWPVEGGPAEEHTDSVTEESATLAASPAPLRAGAEAGGRAEVGTREAQRKRKHGLISHGSSARAHQ
jgi:hypothetical protein